VFLNHIPNSIFKTNLLTTTDKLLYGKLMQYAGKNGMARPRQKTIAINMNLSTRQVKRSINRLVQLKLISIIRSKEDKFFHRCNKYYFLWHGILEDSCKKDIFEIGDKDVTLVSEIGDKDVTLVSEIGDKDVTYVSDTDGTFTEKKDLKEKKDIKKDTDLKVGDLEKEKMNTKYDNIKKDTKEDTKNILNNKTKTLNISEIFSLFNSSLEDNKYNITQRSLTTRERGLIKSLRTTIENEKRNIGDYIRESVSNWDYIREKLSGRPKQFPSIGELCYLRSDILGALSTIKKPVYVVDDRPLGTTVVYRRENELPKNITKEHREKLIYQMQENGEVEVAWPMK
jgi:hypothetical protein